MPAVPAIAPWTWAPPPPAASGQEPAPPTQDTSGAAPAPVAPPEPPAPAPQDRLALPRGAFIALRKSGGFKFSAREIVVYRGGRATIQSSETPGQVLTRNLTSAQVADLRALLEQIDFAQVAAAAGRQNPDAFAYEIVARVRRKSYTVETFDGSIPESLAPLIRQMGLL